MQIRSFRSSKIKIIRSNIIRHQQTMENFMCPRVPSPMAVSGCNLVLYLHHAGGSREAPSQMEY
jgi:hypothetical protein